MDHKRTMLQHFLATLAYRTQKALREAPDSFADFRLKAGVRTPHELVWHMNGVMLYARTFLVDTSSWLEKMPSFSQEINRFHETLEGLRQLLDSETPFRDMSAERLLQGPFSDAMTHAGQLAMLRRLHGRPVAPENFVMANIDSDNLSPDQPDPVSPDDEWRDAENE